MDAGAGSRAIRERSSQRLSTLGRDSTIVLDQGLKVAGRVVDAKGQPVRGAGVVLANDRWGSNPPTATTDPDGRFTLTNCDPGNENLTVEADGFAPRWWA